MAGDGRATEDAMNRAGCRSCGDVIVSRHGHKSAMCSCGNVSTFAGGWCSRGEPLVWLHAAADVLAFKLEMSGREDEAAKVREARR
jgi:hypothetical protein